MGTIHFIGCRDCGVSRDIDKFYSMRKGVDTREKALSLSEEIVQRDYFRSALLVAFLADHSGHNCTTFTENQEEIRDEFQEEDYTVFWRSPKDKTD